MAEVTRVPLQPIGKGILTKLWIGIAIAVLLAAGVAWASRYEGVTVDTLAAGEGPSPSMDDIVLVNYEGRLPDGTVFDSGEQAAMPVGGVVPGFADALTRMQTGGRYVVNIPADLAYGDEGAGGGVIPPGSDLEFRLTVRNRGTRDLPQNATVRGVVSDGDASQVLLDQPLFLTGGESRELRLVWPANLEGELELAVELDGHGLAESDLTNNSATLAFTVGEYTVL